MAAAESEREREDVIQRMEQSAKDELESIQREMSASEKESSDRIEALKTQLTDVKVKAMHLRTTEQEQQTALLRYRNELLEAKLRVDREVEHATHRTEEQMNKAQHEAVNNAVSLAESVAAARHKQELVKLTLEHQNSKAQFESAAKLAKQKLDMVQSDLTVCNEQSDSAAVEHADGLQRVIRQIVSETRSMAHEARLPIGPLPHYDSPRRNRQKGGVRLVDDTIARLQSSLATCFQVRQEAVQQLQSQRTAQVSELNKQTQLHNNHLSEQHFADIARLRQESEDKLKGARATMRLELEEQTRSQKLKMDKMRAENYKMSDTVTALKLRESQLQQHVAHLLQLYAS